MGAGLDRDLAALPVVPADEVQGGGLGGQAQWLHRQVVQVLRQRRQP